MPNALTHILGGAVVAILLAATLPTSVEEKVACGLLALGAALLPDIDHPRGTARKVYKMAGTVGGAILISVFFLEIGLGLLAAIAAGITAGLLLVAVSELFIPRHRGIVHSWKFAVMLGIAVYTMLLAFNVQAAPLLAFALVAGYTSHIILDSVM